MKFVALVSGGKDSYYAISLAIEAGHELVGCVHLAAPTMNDDNPTGRNESYMYQTAASEAVQCQVQDCMENVPFFSYPRTGHSLHTSLVYSCDDDTVDTEKRHDEVHDLYEALRHAQTQLRQKNSNSITVQAVCSGAILSNYQRVRVEDVCRRLQLLSLAYAWRKASPSELVHDMTQRHGLQAIVVQTAAPPGLVPKRHLGRDVWDLHPYLRQCHERYQLQVCGEGGEYESLVLDCPLFTRGRLVLDRVEIRLDAHDDGIGTLYIHECHAEPRDTVHERIDAVSSVTVPTDTSPETPVTTPTLNDAPTVPAMADHTSVTAPIDTSPETPVTTPTLNDAPTVHAMADQQTIAWRPLVRRLGGGLWSVSDVGHNSHFDFATDVVHQAHGIFATLHNVLHAHDCTAHDVVMVHVYLADMDDFRRINAVYADFFGTHVPPSRSTVAIDYTTTSSIHSPRRIRLDCVVQSGSGAFLRWPTDTRAVRSDVHPYARAAHATASSGGPNLRTVLHVQSRSHWAPVCVGPYAQVNTIRDSVHFLAGQIGLVPATMQLRTGASSSSSSSSPWIEQLDQCWTNVASVLDALDAASIAPHTLSCLICYSQDIEEHTLAQEQMATLCRGHIATNGGIIPGHVEGLVLNSTTQTSHELMWGGYEDEETQRAMEGDARVDDGADEKVPVSPCPILVVEIAQLPVGALTEIEVVAVSRHTATCLGGLSTLSSTHVETTSASWNDCSPLGWDTGHEFPLRDESSVGLVLDASFQCLGVQPATSTRPATRSCVASALVTAAATNESTRRQQWMDPRWVLSSMLAKLSQEPSFDDQNVLHLRLYYSTTFSTDFDSIRSALDRAVGGQWTSATTPAVTVIPVSDMFTLFHQCNDKEINHPFFAVQALSLDPLSLEQALWIHQKR